MGVSTMGTDSSRSRAAIIAALALVATGCGSGDGVLGAGPEATGEHSRGWPILVGEWAFDHGDRCGDGDEDVRAPGCFVTDEGADGEDAATLAAIAGVGSVFTSGVDVTLTHRGGLVRSEPTGDATNPERRTVMVFVGVAFPESMPGEDDLSFVEFGHERPAEFAFAFSDIGSGDPKVWPNGDGTYDGILYRPEPGETLTLAAVVVQSGPSSLLGEDDPTVDVRSSYTGNLLSEDQESGNTTLALVGQDPDKDVLDDVRATIERVAADEDDDVDAGLASFESTFAAFLAGEALASDFPMDPDADPGADGADLSDDLPTDLPADVDTAVPSALPEATASGYGPFGDETEDPASPYDDGFSAGEDRGYEDGSEQATYDDTDTSLYADPGDDETYEQGYRDAYHDAYREGWLDAGHSESELPPEAGGPTAPPGDEATAPAPGDFSNCTTDGPMAECD